MLNGMNKIRGGDNPTKRLDPILLSIVKNQLEDVEIENASFCPHICNMYYALNMKCIRLEI